MKYQLYTHFRIAIYGAVFFAALGYLMQLTQLFSEAFFLRLIGYLSLAGAVSFSVTYLAGLVLINLFKDLVYGSN